MHTACADIDPKRRDILRKEYDFSKAKRGAPMAAVGKTRITIMLDDDVIAFYRSRAEAAGTGYQTLINAELRAAINGKTSPLARAEKPVTARMLRKILREELPSS